MDIIAFYLLKCKYSWYVRIYLLCILAVFATINFIPNSFAKYFVIAAINLYAGWLLLQFYTQSDSKESEVFYKIHNIFPIQQHAAKLLFYYILFELNILSLSQLASSLPNSADIVINSIVGFSIGGLLAFYSYFVQNLVLKILFFLLSIIAGQALVFVFGWKIALIGIIPLLFYTVITIIKKETSEFS